MLDYGTAAQITLGFSVTCFILGYVLGKVGIANIESELSTIKGLLSGQQKVSIVPKVIVPATVDPVQTAA